MKPIGLTVRTLFADLERRAQTTLALAEKVRAALPAPEKDHVVSASYRGETLLVSADSAVWGARIRYAQNELIKQLQAQGETQVTKIKVRVGRVRGMGEEAGKT